MAKEKHIQIAEKTIIPANLTIEQMAIVKKHLEDCLAANVKAIIELHKTALNPGIIRELWLPIYETKEAFNYAIEQQIKEMQKSSGIFYCCKIKSNSKGLPCTKQCTDCYFIANNKTELL